jgi:cell division protein FtsI/penicillin-binding protein 2
MGSRFAFLAAGLTLVYGFLFFHLYEVQVLNNDTYSAKAESQYAASLGLASASRGTIYFTDKNGNRFPAAINKDFPVVYAVPSVIADPQAAATQAAAILGQPTSELERKFSRENSQYTLLDKDPSQTIVEQVEAAKIKGVYVEYIPRRFYPFGSLGAHLLGYLGPNQDNNGVSGKYGVEQLYNKELSGREDVTLTIDPTIQAEGEHIIKKLLANFRGKKASMMVVDPETGKVLAMAAAPSFDPNDYSLTTDISRFLNPLIQEIYEPGSVMKVITMAAALDSGKITSQTTYNDTGSLKLDGYTIRNWDLKAHGLMTMTQVIERSLNTGAAFAQQRTGNAAFASYLKDFGFDSKTGIGLPGELSGDLRQLVPGKPQVNFATASFGQGVAVTPIEMMQSFAALANDGMLMRPYVDASESPEEIRRAVSPEAAAQAVDMMVSAVDRSGVAAINGFSVGGKTGTAQVPNNVSGGYTKEVVHTYTGVFPASDPQVVIFLKLDEPAGAPLAGGTVVPAFKEFAQFLINYYNIPPDRI